MTMMTESETYVHDDAGVTPMEEDDYDKLIHEGASHTVPPWGTVLMSLTGWLATLPRGGPASWVHTAVGPQQPT